MGLIGGLGAGLGLGLGAGLSVGLGAGLTVVWVGFWCRSGSWSNLSSSVIHLQKLLSCSRSAHKFTVVYLQQLSSGLTSCVLMVTAVLEQLYISASLC